MNKVLVSCIIVTLRASETYHILDSLLAQTVSADCEFIVVAPTERPEGFPFPQVLWEQMEFSNRGQAAECGLRMAQGEFVAFLENHAFPDPEWLEKIVEVFELEGVAGASSGFSLANPKTKWSRAETFLYYLKSEDIVSSPQITGSLPWFNVVYRRLPLLELQIPLDSALDRQVLLQSELKSRAYKLALAPGVAFHHLNSSSAKCAMRTAWELGRSEAVRRAERWPSWRKLVQALLYPVYLPRRMAALSTQPSLELWPFVVLLLWATTTGELLGYCLGASDSDSLLKHELELSHRLCEQELREWSRQA